MSNTAIENVHVERTFVEYRKGNYLVTLPSEWRDKNRQDLKDSAHLFFSPSSTGYLMIATGRLVREKINVKELKVNLSRTKELIVNASKSRSIDPEFMEDILREQARFELISLVMHGYSMASIRYDEKDEHDFEKLFLDFNNMQKRLEKATSLKGKSILKIEMDPVDNYMTATIPRQNEKDPLEYDYLKLTNTMLEHHNELFRNVIECLIGNLNQNLIEYCITLEGSLDFLWAYYLRQLKRGVNVGLFSGAGLSGIHVVCLSMFAKILEHDADSLVRILSLLHYLKKKLDENQDSEFSEGELSEFITMVRRDLTTIHSECITSMNFLPGALRISLQGKLLEKDHQIAKSIAGTIAFYHGKLIKDTGTASESYITQRDQKSSDEIGKELFGGYEDIMNRVEQKYSGKGYSYVLSQIASELRRIAKFPRNIAVTALAILSPIMHKA